MKIIMDPCPNSNPCLNSNPGLDAIEKISNPGLLLMEIQDLVDTMYTYNTYSHTQIFISHLPYEYVRVDIYVVVNS